MKNIKLKTLLKEEQYQYTTFVLDYAKTIVLEIKHDKMNEEDLRDLIEKYTKHTSYDFMSTTKDISVKLIKT